LYHLVVYGRKYPHHSIANTIELRRPLHRLCFLPASPFTSQGFRGLASRHQGGVPRKSPPTLNHSLRQQHSKHHNSSNHDLAICNSSRDFVRSLVYMYSVFGGYCDEALTNPTLRNALPPSQPSTSRLLTKRSQFKTNITLVSADESLRHYSSSTTEVCMRIEILVEPAAETVSNSTLNTRSSSHALKTTSHICANQEEISAVETDMCCRC